MYIIVNMIKNTTTNCITTMFWDFYIKIISSHPSLHKKNYNIYFTEDVYKMKKYSHIYML